MNEKRATTASGFAQGEHDSPEDAPFGAAVDSRGFAQFIRNRHEELAHEEDAEGRAEECGEPEGPECAEHLQWRVVADEAEDDEEGKHEDGKGDHHGGEHEGEKEAAAFEFDAGEAVRDDRAGKRGAGDGEGGNDQCVSCI